MLVSFRKNIFALIALHQTIKERQLLALARQAEVLLRSHGAAQKRSVDWWPTWHGSQV